jgi:hypothetical protein
VRALRHRTQSARKGALLTGSANTRYILALASNGRGNCRLNRQRSDRAGAEQRSPPPNARDITAM